MTSDMQALFRACAYDAEEGNAHNRDRMRLCAKTSQVVPLAFARLAASAPPIVVQGVRIDKLSHRKLPALQPDSTKQCGK